MSREQAAPKRGATERAQRRRRYAPASLCCFAGTGASPAQREAGMRPAAIAASRRHLDGFVAETVKEAAA